MFEEWALALEVAEEDLHYFEWLCDLVNVYREDDVIGSTDGFMPTYWLLLERLWETEFTWFVPNDDNRIADGLVLRELYFNIADLSSSAFTRGATCSVLEMLIALAQRMGDMLAMPGEDINIISPFFEMLDNLNLLGFHDELYLGKNQDLAKQSLYERDMKKVDKILETLINRTYSKNGKGGLFPLRHTHLDQRTQEIWYQMNEYVLENYM